MPSSRGSETPQSVLQEREICGLLGTRRLQTSFGGDNFTENGTFKVALKDGYKFDRKGG